jgi:hypothetical protein
VSYWPEPDPHETDIIVRLFKQGTSPNHIVFLMDYKFRIDEINLAIRRYIVALEQKCNT